MITCQSCGKSFGTKSIQIHEPQCIKRMQTETDKQFHSRKKEPIRQQKSEMMIVHENLSRPTGVSRIGRHAYIIQFV